MQSIYELDESIRERLMLVLRVKINERLYKSEKLVDCMEQWDFSRVMSSEHNNKLWRLLWLHSGNVLGDDRTMAVCPVRSFDELRDAIDIHNAVQSIAKLCTPCQVYWFGSHDRVIVRSCVAEEIDNFIKQTGLNPFGAIEIGFVYTKLFQKTGRTRGSNSKLYWGVVGNPDGGVSGRDTTSISFRIVEKRRTFTSASSRWIEEHGIRIRDLANSA